VPDHIGRNGGEPLSIRQMIARMIADHDLDPARVFVTGLSAGGAMTAAMLATWPELFAGGAIVAGLPYAAATSMTEAFDRMRGHGMPSAGTLGEKVRSASPHQGLWPRLSIWHGTADQTVALSNMEAIAGQWRAVHGLPDAPSRTDAIDGARRAQWCDARGRAVLETITIDGMGHGTPIAPSAADGVGAVMPHMLDAGISSTRRIAEFWGIAATSEQASLDQGMAGRQALPGIVLPLRRAPDKHAAAVSGVTRVIEDALRAAGLLR
jgi:poly(3-hydroxybutyrate) depolymerase